MTSLLLLLAAPFVFDLGPKDYPAISLDGRFDEAPVPHWARRLPGVPIAAFTHTERSRPTTDGTSLFLGSASSNELIQLSRGDGELVQVYAAGAPVQAEAVVQDGRVYFADTGGYTWCYEVGSTEPLWSHFGGAPIGSKPTLAEGRLYVSSVDDVLYALDTDDGGLLWRYARPADATRDSELTLFGAPAPLIAGRLVLAGFSDGAVVALDAVDGEVNWERRVGEGRYPDVIATLVLDDGDVFAGGYSEPLVSFDVGTRNVRWRLDVGSAEPPLLTGDVLFHGATDGKLRRIDRATGTVVWTWDSGTTGALTQPQGTGAGLLVASSDGSLYLVDADLGTLNWSYDAGATLSGITSAPLVMGRQVVAVTNAGRVISMLAPRNIETVDQPLFGNERLPKP